MESKLKIQSLTLRSRDKNFVGFVIQYCLQFNCLLTHLGNLNKQVGNHNVQRRHYRKLPISKYLRSLTYQLKRLIKVLLATPVNL